MSRTRPLTYGAIVDTKVNGDFTVNPATTTGLTFGYNAGRIQTGGDLHTIAAGTVTLTDNTTNNVTLTSQGVVAVEGSGTTIYQVTTASGAITAIVDTRAAPI